MMRTTSPAAPGPDDPVVLTINQMRKYINMNTLIDEIRSINGHAFGSFNWWIGMQLTKLACVTALDHAMKADPRPSEVPTLDERNERDYQAAYAQVER